MTIFVFRDGTVEFMEFSWEPFFSCYRPLVG